MPIVYASKICKLLGLNPFEKQYYETWTKREYGRCIAIDYATIDIVPLILPVPQPIEHKLEKVRLDYHEHYLDIGINNEPNVLRTLRTKYTISSTQRYCEKSIQHNTHTLKIIGKIDGIISTNDEKHLLEIKIRRKYGGIRPHEHIQIQTYMYLMNMKKCVFCEVLDDKITLYEIDYNHSYFSAIIKRLFSIVALCEQVVKDI